MKASQKFFNVVLLVHNGGIRLQFVFLILGGELVSDIYYSHTHTGGGACRSNSTSDDNLAPWPHYKDIYMDNNTATSPPPPPSHLLCWVDAGNRLACSAGGFRRDERVDIPIGCSGRHLELEKQWRVGAR